MSGPLGIENDLLDRLQDRIGPLACVASGAAFQQQALDVGELAPVVVTEPLESDIFDSAGRSRHIVEDQTWQFAIVVRHTGDPERPRRVDYSELDAILLSIVRGFAGWEPPAGVKELRYLGRSDILSVPGLLQINVTFSILYHLSAA